MKKNKRKQSNPTLTELLDPYLRNPPSLPPLSPPQSPAPQSLPVPLASLHTVQRVPAKPWRQFHTSVTVPQFYQVHPRNFRDLVQRLTGASAANNNGTQKLEERRVENIDYGPGIEEEWMLPDMGTCHLDWCAPTILSPKTMGSVGYFCSEKSNGESWDMGSAGPSL